jgi:glutathione synthase/RimK-type ligase-like ATP-grasp enzyme
LGWQKTILKPAVSGAARHTYLLTPDTLVSQEAVFRQLVTHEAMLLQPFQEDIVTRGEVSLMVFGGVYSHAVLKVAKQGDFRVQDDFGGSVHDYQATPEEIAFAEQAVAACDTMPLYARVDILTDNEGQIALGELELIEPELWFRNNPAAADSLAVAVKTYLSTA